MKVKIAVVQCEIKQYDPKSNVKKAEEFIKSASQRKLDIIIFPEDFICGPIRLKKEYADEHGKYRKHFQQLAKKYKINIIPGTIIEKDEFGFANVAYYIDSEGKIKARYKKVNLWHPERKYITAGNEICVFNTKYGKVGLIICWDLAFPEIFKRMIQRGVSIVFCPSFWCAGDAGVGVKYNKNAEEVFVDSLSISRACENEIIFVYCNAAGKLEIGNMRNTLIGHSQITAPFKGVIKRLNHNKEEMFIQEVDTEILKDAERAYKIRKDIKTRII